MSALALNSPSNLIPNIQTAANAAFDKLASDTFTPHEIHKLSVCSQVSSLMINPLIENGHLARREIAMAEGVGVHSYVVIDNDGEEILADATWQQFLRPGTATDDIPKVLVGDRGEIMRQARDYGVSNDVLKIWEFGNVAENPQQQAAQDRSAEAAAEQAAENGAWKRFVSNEAR